MKRSKILFLSLFASFLAIAAFSGVLAAKNTQHVEKAEAASVSKSRIVVELEDQCWSTSDGRNPTLHIWDISVDSSMEYGDDVSSELKSSSAINDFEAGATKRAINSDGSIDTGFTWIEEKNSKRYWKVQLPWYVTGFTFKIYCGSYWATDENTVTKRGSHMVYNYGSWNSWTTSLVQDASSQTNTYSVTNYTITAAKTGGQSGDGHNAQVKGNGGSYATSGNYFPRQKISLKATSGSISTFNHWSSGHDVNSAETYDYVGTANKTYTATFVQIPALSTPVLSIDSSNNVTWAAVSNAQSYSVTVDGETSTYTTSQRSVAGILKPGTHTVSVIAKGDGVNYVDSASASKQYTVDNGFFLVGDFNSWNTTTFAGAIRMTSPETGKYTADVNLSANQKFEVVYATNDRVDWQNWGDLKTPHTADSSYPVQGQTGDAGKSVTVTNAGSYTVNVTFNDSKAYYEVIAKDYFAATFKLFVGSTEVSLTKTSEFVYSASNVSLTSGQVLTYKRNGTEVSVVSAKADATNNLESSRKVVANRASATVEVNVYDGTIYTNLGVAEGYHMLRSGVITTLTHNETPSDPSFIEYYSDAISFSANETIRFVDIKASGTTLPVVFDVLTINGGGLGDKFDNSTGVLKAKVAVTSAVYLKLKSGADEVYFGTISEAEQKAEEFASAFNSAISAVCDDQGGTTVSALRTAWQSQKTSFGKLLEASQNILKDATVDHPVVVIREFVKKYMYVATKYKTQLGDGYNFLNKTIPNKANLISLAINDSGSTSTLLIGGIAVVIAGIAVGGYFLLRKKKEN